jgi:hypothetical protein
MNLINITDDKLTVTKYYSEVGTINDPLNNVINPKPTSITVNTSDVYIELFDINVNGVVNTYKRVVSLKFIETKHPLALVSSDDLDTNSTDYNINMDLYYNTIKDKISTSSNNSTSGGGASTLSELSDVNLSSLTNNDLISYDNGNWVNIRNTFLNSSNGLTTDVVFDGDSFSHNFILNEIGDVIIGSQNLSIDTTNSINVSSSSGMFYNADYSINGISNHGDRWITDKGYVDSSNYQFISFTVDSNSTTPAHVTFPGRILIDVNSEVMDDEINNVLWFYRTSTSNGWVKHLNGTISELNQFITDNIGVSDKIGIRPLSQYNTGDSGLGSVGFDYKILYR